MPIPFRSPFNTLVLVIACKTLILIGVILWGAIGLSPDEAQYWTWSRQLDWGYYSKPPGIAWQIAGGTHLFGQTEWGVRFFSLLWSIGQSLLVYALAIQAGLSTRSAFWSGTCMALCPLSIIGSLLAITDGGCLFFWTLACFFLVKALRNSQEPSPFQIGLCILGGALFKWPVYFFWVFFLISRQLWFPRQSIKSLFSGLALSLLGLLPSFWWNSTHNWATFRHVSSTLQGGHGSSGGNLPEFIGSQFLLLSPILFLLLIMSFWEGWRRRQTLSPSLLFCGLVPFVCLSVAATLSCFQKIQGNWIIFAYPTALVWLMGYTCEQLPRLILWLKFGLVFSLCLTLLVFLLPKIYTDYPDRPAFLSYRLNPFRQMMGWSTLQEELDKAGYDPAVHFLVSDKYQTTSLLSFYHSAQKQAYFLNLQGMRQNQFSYWPGLADEQLGKTGYFVWVENMPHLKRDWKTKLAFYQNELEKYFEKVEMVGFTPLLFDQQKASKGAFFFRCSGCLPHSVPDSGLY